MDLFTFGMEIFAIAIGLMVVTLILCEGANGQTEPTCLSRYDYDYKMMTKITQMEYEHKTLMETVKEQQATISRLQNQLALSETKSADAINILKDKMSKVENATLLAVTGNVYIRWGRTSCPGNGTHLVYDGYAAGSHYTSTGAAANYLCLPKDPKWGVYEDGVQAGAKIYGAEYEYDHRNRQNFFGTDPREFDVLCAVCHTTRSTVYMLPAKNECPSGWTMEYHGYLSASASGQPAATENVCMYERPEWLPEGSENLNGALFYFVESMCGSLRCPPYVNGRELTCAVCSK